jgi:gamma-glutamyltranspeptidase/glutathione hydrolase
MKEFSGMRLIRWAVVTVLGFNIAWASSGCASATASPAKYGAVATVDPQATHAAMRTLRDGGNAIDAAVAAMLTLGVVDGHNSGIGGGCFILVRTKDGQTVAIDARETAPALATRDMYLVDGKADPNLSQTGPLAVATPGALAGYDLALRELGQKKLDDLLRPAADLAEAGFRVNDTHVRRLTRAINNLKKFEGSRAVFLKPDGRGYVAGDTLRQPDLAGTYRAIADAGTDYFYRGEFAKTVDAWMVENKGVLRAADFAGYKPVKRQPLVSTYRGRTIIGMPPPSSGGLHVAQILAMLERFNLASMSDVDRATVIANAMNLAFADRAYWLGDPDFAEVPRGLIDVNYLAERSKLILTDRALTVESHGQPPRVDPEFFERQSQKHTTHVSVADAQGNVCAITATVNTTFGSKVIVPGTGVILNNEMDDFSAQPGVPNSFKLIGQEANAVGPLKRPLSSMSPTLVLDEKSRPVIVIGAAGGPKIISQVLCVLVNLIDLKLPPEEAMKRPRLHHQWRPDELWIEKTMGKETLAEMKHRGFKLNEAKPGGATNLVVIDPATGGMTPVSEPRLKGQGAAE